MGLELKLPKPMKFHDDELMKFLVRQTERDVDIVFGCYNHGPLTVRQIQRWFFPNGHRMTVHRYHGVCPCCVNPVTSVSSSEPVIADTSI